MVKVNKNEVKMSILEELSNPIHHETATNARSERSRGRTQRKDYETAKQYCAKAKKKTHRKKKIHRRTKEKEAITVPNLQCHQPTPKGAIITSYD